MVIRKKKTTHNSSERNVTGWLYFIPIVISLIGLLFVFEASSIRSFNEYGESFHYFKLQFLWILMGSVIMFIASRVNYRKLYYLSFIFMALSITLLIIVLLPSVGSKVGGARRWINLGFFNLQPTELAKAAVIIYLSSWFAHKERKRFFSFLILLGILMFLILAQPDMGTAIIVYFVSIILYYLAGNDLHYLLMLIPVSLAGFGVLIKIAPYRFNRLLAFLDPSKHTQDIGYHINQILISLANGGFFGRGIGESRQKYLFLPEAHTDSIFAIVGEEIGFFGCLFLIGLFFFLILYLYRATVEAKDRFGYLLAGGIFAYFSLQIIINLAGMVSLLPLTGVPLPFFSYGGSNMLISFALMGVMINIAKTRS